MTESSSSCPDCGKQVGASAICHSCLILGMDVEMMDQAEVLPEIAGYQIIEEIGFGGMGLVYRAIQADLKREVALKLVLDGRLAGREVKQRFLMEAECAARLDHPAIVPIYGSGEDQGFYYLACRLMKGGSLAENPPEPGKANQQQIARIVLRLANALHYGHQRGIIHRDVKPANILLGDHGEAYLGDFGLARHQDGSPRLTVTGQFSGSPGYMAPEQLEGRDLSMSMDVYSLGVVLFELLTGELPFEQPTLPKLFEDIRSKEVRFPDFARDLDSSLKAVCLKCLRKKPSARYGSARLLAEDLGRYLNQRPVMARPVGPLRRVGMWAKRNPSIAVLMAALLVVGGIATGTFLSNVHLQEKSLLQSQGSERASRHRLARELLTKAERICRDGNVELALPMLYEARRESDDAPGILKRVDRLIGAWSSSARTFFKHPGDGRVQIAVAPDGEGFASWDGGPICCLWGAEPRKIDLGEGVSDASYSPDGRLVVICSQSQAVVYRVDSLEVICRIRRKVPEGEPSVRLLRHRAAFSPDGEFLVLAFSHVPSEVRRVSDFSLFKELPLPPLVENRGDVVKMGFVREDIVIAYGGGLLVYDQGGDEVRKLRASERITDFALNPEGDLLAVAEYARKVQLYEFGSLDLLSEGEHLNIVTSVCFSEDGKMLVSGSRERSAKLWEVIDRNKLVLFYTRREKAAVTHCRWVSGTEGFVNACEDGYLRFYDPPYRKVSRRVRLDGSSTHSLAPSGNRFIVGTNWGAVLKIEPLSYSPKNLKLNGEARVVRAHADDLVMLTDWGEGRYGVERRRRRNGELVQSLELGSKPRPRSMDLSRDGRFAVKGDAEGILQVWETSGMTEIFNEKITEGKIHFSTIHEATVAFFTRSQKLVLYRIDLGKVIAERDSNDQLATFAFSPNGEHLALGFSNGMVRLVSAQDLEDRGYFPTSRVHGNQLRALEFNDSGNLLASGGLDQLAFVHRVSDGAILSGRLQHEDYVWALAFSEDDRTLVTAGQEPRVRFFDPLTGHQLGPPRLQSSWLNAVIFDDGKVIGIGSDHYLREIELPDGE